MDPKKLQAEIDKNYKAFKALLPSIIDAHRGKYALMSNGDVVSYYSSWGDARTTGEKFYDGVYSIQEVTDQAEDLGFFSHAIHMQ